MGARQGLMPLKRLGVARNAASKVACLTARMAPAWPPEFDSSKLKNSYIPNEINRLAGLFEIPVVARLKP
jgi:hypothetical protein